MTARIPVEDRTAFLTRTTHPWWRIGAIVGLVVLWEVFARVGWVPVLFLPSPIGVAREVIRVTYERTALSILRASSSPAPPSHHASSG